MSHLNTIPRSRIAYAAAMRAAGESWEQIAVAVCRSPERVRRWPQRYAEEWSRHYRAAETYLLADVACEAQHRLRVLMRSKEESIQLAAALGVLKVRHAERTREYRLHAAAASTAAVDPDVVAFVQHCQRLPDEELELMITEGDRGSAEATKSGEPK